MNHIIPRRDQSIKRGNNNPLFYCSYMTTTNHNHKAAGGDLSIYRARLSNSRSKYILALDDEDAAWPALALSKELNAELLDIIKVNG